MTIDKDSIVFSDTSPDLLVNVLLKNGETRKVAWKDLESFAVEHKDDICTEKPKFRRPRMISAEIKNKLLSEIESIADIDLRELLKSDLENVTTISDLTSIKETVYLCSSKVNLERLRSALGIKSLPR
jgi:hypothetical protein